MENLEKKNEITIASIFYFIYKNFQANNRKHSGQYHTQTHKHLHIIKTLTAPHFGHDLRLIIF